MPTHAQPTNHIFNLDHDSVFAWRNDLVATTTPPLSHELPHMQTINLEPCPSSSVLDLDRPFGDEDSSSSPPFFRSCTTYCSHERAYRLLSSSFSPSVSSTCPPMQRGATNGQPPYRRSAISMTKICHINRLLLVLCHRSPAHRSNHLTFHKSLADDVWKFTIRPSISLTQTHSVSDICYLNHQPIYFSTTIMCHCFHPAPGTLDSL